MKKIKLNLLIPLTIVTIVFTVIFYMSKNKKPDDNHQLFTTQEENGPKKYQVNSFDLEITGNNYTILWVVVKDIAKIKLSPNFLDKRTSDEIMS